MTSPITVSKTPSVILSGFADEAANEKEAVAQYAALAAAGLQHYSIRFIDVGNGIKNAMALTKSELKRVVKLQAEYGLSVVHQSGRSSCWMSTTAPTTRTSRSRGI